MKIVPLSIYNLNPHNPQSTSQTLGAGWACLGPVPPAKTIYIARYCAVLLSHHQTLCSGSIRSGRRAKDALRESIALAQICEHAGCHRYWRAEHHRTPALAGPAPEIMFTLIAAATDHMRIGSGGIM